MTQGYTERRLSAILVADVAGYTRLVERDTDGVVAAWRASRNEVIDPKIAAHSGRIVKVTGDGFVAEFSSARAAVSCALAMQQDLGPTSLDFRMGISLGDVVDDGEDIHGEGVNIAARIEALADAGGLCLSSAVYEAVRNQLEAEFVDCGEHTVKHVSSPVRVWKWFPGGADQGTVKPSPDSQRKDQPPLILLEPFTASGETDTAAEFSADLSAELVRTLANRRGIRVVSGASRMGVIAYRLQGRCRVTGEHCRLQMVMSLGATGEHVWSERFDGSVRDWDEFMETVVAKVSGALRIQENAYSGAALAATPDVQLDLPDLMSKAAFLFYRYDLKSTELSRATMERAVELAPNSAMAIAMLAWSLGHMVPFGLERLTSEQVDRALSLADRAIELDPKLDFVFHARAWLRLWLRHNTDGCISDAKRTLAANPSYHKGTQDLGLATVFSGRPREGLKHLAQVVEQVPSEPIVPLLLAVQGIGNLLLGNADLARELATEGHERRPLLPVPALAYAICVADDEELIASNEFGTMVDGLHLRVSSARQLPFKREDDLRRIEALLRRAGLPD